MASIITCLDWSIPFCNANVSLQRTDFHMQRIRAT